jgi:hypothetical protein
MPTFEQNERHVLSERPVDPVPRREVEAYLERFQNVASPLTSEGRIDQVVWTVWRELRTGMRHRANVAVTAAPPREDRSSSLPSLARYSLVGVSI